MFIFLFVLCSEKYPLARRDVSPHSLENKENQGVAAPKKTTATSAANTDNTATLTLRSMDNQAPIKEKERRKVSF